MRVAFAPIPEDKLKAAIKSLTILIDTRERENTHVIDFFRAKKINYEIRKLDAADYSVELSLGIEGLPTKISLEKYVVIERKHSIDEIATNLGTDRERFDREFLRLKAAGTKCILLLENFSWERLFIGPASGGYRSQMPPDVIASNLNTIITRYNLSLYTLNEKAHSGRLIASLLSRAVYEYLKES